ncbi:MAG: ABC transporter permease [Saprospiraceae bacterium]
MKSQFIAFIVKEFYHVFRDKKTLLLLFGMPIAQIVLFGFALTNEIKNAKVMIYDQAKDEASRAIIQKLEANATLEMAGEIRSEKEILSSFKNGNIKLIVIFPSHFQQNLLHQNHAQVKIIADASDPNTATTLTNYTTNIIMDYQKSLWNGQKLPYEIKTDVRMMYNPELKGATNYVPGVMALVLLLISVLMTSVSIVKEKETGTMEVLLVSPFKPVFVVISKAIPYFLLSLINLTIILILSVTLLKMPIKGSLLLLYFSSSLLILAALSLGLLISNVTRSQQEAMLISLMAMLLPTMMLTGFMFPLENMPLPLQIVSNIIPSKWYYIIIKSVMIKGLGISFIWKEMLILLGMTVVLLTISIRKFKYRLA